MTAAKDISEEYENWLRLMTLVDFAGRSLCRDVLFKIEKLPEDEVQLFKVLEPLKYVVIQTKVKSFVRLLEKPITVNLM